MNLPKKFPLLMAIPVSLFFLLNYSNFVKAEIKPNKDKDEVFLSSKINFEPKEDEGEPNATTGGGRRGSPILGNCPKDKNVMKGIVPTTTKYWLTIKKQPHLFVYIPSTSASAILVEIKDDQKVIQYESLIPINLDQGRILEINFPENELSLKVNTNYKWSIRLLCNYNSRLHTSNVESLKKLYNWRSEPYFRGDIKRIETPSSLTNHTNEMPSFNLAQKYAKNGLWFETLTTLSELRKSQPNNSQLREAWQELLQSQAFKDNIINAELEEMTQSNFNN